MIYFLTIITFGRLSGDWLDVAGAFQSEDAAMIAATAMSDHIDRWTKRQAGSSIYLIANAQVGLQPIQWTIFPGQINMIREDTTRWIATMREEAMQIGSEIIQ